MPRDDDAATMLHCGRCGEAFGLSSLLESHCDKEHSGVVYRVPSSSAGAHMCGECEMQSRTGTGAHGDNERCSCYYEGLHGTPTPTGIDADYDWALWCEKWRAAVDTCASLSAKEYKRGLEEGERAGREAERGSWLANVREFRVYGDDKHGENVNVSFRGQRWGKGPILWAVTRRGCCLSKDGEWEYEPQPSSRSDDFIARCRWTSFDDAYAAAIRSRSSEGKK